MGQRHQFFIIAKMLGRYRRLAAVHHQWNYGHTALRGVSGARMFVANALINLTACERLVQIFQEPHNTSLLKHEIAKAKTLRQEDWNVHLDWDAKPMFPFLTTCLVIGASVDLTGGKVSNASPLPWNMEFDRCDNNDGITIIDISEPEAIRYCFVIFNEISDEAVLEDPEEEDPEEDESASNPTRSMTPLRGAEYLTIYYREEEWTSNMKDSVANLDKISLIPVSVLNEAWPHPNWASRAERGLQPADDDQSAAGVVSGTSNLSLTNLSMMKSIERALDEEDELLDYVEELPIFKPSLKDYLYKHPSAVLGRRFGFAMLQKALGGEEALDIRPFTDLSVDRVIRLIEGAANPDRLKVLDISGNRNIVPDDIPKILEKISVEKLYVWDNPQLPYKIFLPFVRAGRVRELLHPGLFSAPFEESTKTKDVLMYGAIPRYKDKVPPMEISLPISSFRQLIWISLSYASGESKALDFPVLAELKEYGLGLQTHSSLLVVPLSDAALSPTEFLSSLAKFIRCNATDLWRTYGTVHGGFVFPFGLALRQEEVRLMFHASFFVSFLHTNIRFQATWAISPIPCRQYALSQGMYHSSAAYVERKMHPLSPGEWTVLVIHDRDIADIDSNKECFYVAFVTSEDGKPKVFDADAFMKETKSETFAPKWKLSVSNLKGFASMGKPPSTVTVENCDEESFNNAMALMEMVDRGEIEVR